MSGRFAGRRVGTTLAALLAVLLLCLGAVGLASAALAADGDPTGTATTSDTTTGATTGTTTATATTEATGTTEPTEATETTETTEPTAEPDPTAFTVSDAVFRWGVNDESNNRAFAPGTFNFLSAGEAPDPGSGGTTIDFATGRWPTNGKLAWRAQQGEVTVQKVLTGGTTRTADLSGLTTGPDDRTTIPSPTSGVFSSHQVVIAGGTGEVDPEAGTATIRWKGSFTIFYYSGMTFFSISDPVLRVTPTSARITATASGYASSMEDQSKWTPVGDTTVTLADLTGVGEDQLAAAKGFTSDPKYLKVPFTPADGSSQVRSTPSWGAFPTSFLRFLEKAGSAAYWYSSGGSSDPYKVAGPVTVSWDAKTAIEPEAPAPPPDDDDDEQPDNGAGVAPPAYVPPGVVPQPAGPALPQQVAGAGTPPVAAASAVRQPPVHYALASSPTGDPGSATAGHAWEWALGTLLLLGTAAIAVAPPLMNRLKGNR